jgi:hypothetical protein
VEDRDAIRLSVVLAAPVAGAGFALCLAALKPQIASFGGELLVVDGSRTGSASRWVPDTAEFRTIRLPPGTDVPKLWHAGICVSKGRIIALLVDSCVPRPDWIERILHAHLAPPAVIGGAIDLSSTVGLVDSAVYFCRYSRYMPPFGPCFQEDLPGTNCSYKRDSLKGLQKEMADGFWEAFVHRRMRNRGERLFCDPQILVEHVGPTSGMAFLSVRFAHGRRFAARRAVALSPSQRILRTLASPLVPLLMLQRIAAHVWARRRNRARFLFSLPLLMAFLISWSAGEFFGYLLGPSGQGPRDADENSPVLREV